MIKVTGKAVGTWTKAKLFLSLNSDWIIDSALILLLGVIGYGFAVLLMAITTN